MRQETDQREARHANGRSEAHSPRRCTHTRETCLAPKGGSRTGLSVPMQEALAPLQDSGPTVYMTTRRSPTLLGEGRVRYTLSHTHTSAGHDSTVCVSPSAPGPCASHGGGGAVTAGVRRRRSAAGARLPPTVSPVGVRRSVGAFASGGPPCSSVYGARREAQSAERQAR